MPGAFRIGRIADIDIEANVSWLVILVLLTFSLAVSWFPAAAPRQTAITYWLVGGRSLYWSRAATPASTPG